MLFEKKSLQTVVNPLAIMSINFPMFYIFPRFCISTDIQNRQLLFFWKKVTLLSNPASILKNKKLVYPLQILLGTTLGLSVRTAG